MNFQFVSPCEQYTATLNTCVMERAAAALGSEITNGGQDCLSQRRSTTCRQWMTSITSDSREHFPAALLVGLNLIIVTNRALRLQQRWCQNVNLSFAFVCTSSAKTASEYAIHISIFFVVLYAVRGSSGSRSVSTTGTSAICPPNGTVQIRAVSVAIEAFGRIT